MGITTTTGSTKPSSRSETIKSIKYTAATNYIKMITANLFMDAHVGLIAGRHPQPVEGYIWTDTVIEPLDFDTLESHAETWIDDVVKYDLDNQVIDTMFLYLSGLTSCTISFLKAWERKGYTLADNLVLMYHDRDTNTYVGQQWKS